MKPLSIEEQNELFKSMTKAERAVAVAKDALTQIALGKYVVQRMTYFEIEEMPECPSDSLQQVLRMEDVVCTACALGGIFASCVRLANEFETSDLVEGIVGHNDVFNVGLQAFTARELDIIESTFELFNMDKESQAAVNAMLIDAGLSTVEKHEQEERMVLIMQNIIDNGGYYRPNGLVIAPLTPNKK